MSTHKHFDAICCVIVAITLVIGILFMNGKSLGISEAATTMAYESRIFDTSTVHTVNIIMDDWDAFLSTCTNEEYSACTVVIDGEKLENAAIRAKGNTSLTQVTSYGNNRYSFKIEFDHYDSTSTYYGLDKLCLNNIIQDNTYMKDYLVYQLMAEMGVTAPLCSYVNIFVNDEVWGLYLAVEGVEESFLQRNYGKDYGNLYKPDSMSMGGGRGNGQEFQMEEWDTSNVPTAPTEGTTDTGNAETGQSTFPEGNVPQQTPPDGAGGFLQGQPDGTAGDTGDTSANDIPQMPSDAGETAPDMGQEQNRENPFGQSGGMDSQNADVLLQYIDDDPNSYANIFDNAKTDITDSDKAMLIDSLQKLNEQTELESVVNIDEVIAYFVVHNFVLNFDSYTGSMIHNYYLYEKDGQMEMIPWDYNLAFGAFQSAGDATSLVNYPIDTPVSGDSVESRPMLSWIFSNEAYTALYHQQFSLFLANIFDSGDFSDLIETVKTMIAPYVEADPTKFCTYAEFLTGVDTLETFCLLRAESVSEQLNGTIGLTSDTQDADTWIDAGDLSISDMGSMQNTGDMGIGSQNDMEKIETIATAFQR